jgi:hypothetical protein
LKLVTKYQVNMLRVKVIEILLCIYPDTLEGYDAIRMAGDHFSS